jgi:hypothetical protein
VAVPPDIWISVAIALIRTVAGAVNLEKRDHDEERAYDIARAQIGCGKLVPRKPGGVLYQMVALKGEQGPKRVRAKVAVDHVLCFDLHTFRFPIGIRVTTSTTSPHPREITSMV